MIKLSVSVVHLKMFHYIGTVFLYIVLT